MASRTCARASVSLGLMLALAGCKQQPAEAPSAAPTTPSAAATPPAAAAATDRWLGQWNGPEGTLLRLDGGAGKYQLTIQNLDGPRTFAATSVGEQLHFERDGVKETVRASDGAATGMKWLSEKKDCLRIKPGEGYCRD